MDCKFTDMAGRCVPIGRGCSVCVPACDQDGDGYCPGQQMNVPGGDCNDADPKVHPDAREVCGNGIDDDCNGGIDEGCAVCETAPGTCGPLQSCSGK
jgi:hypothetical protein